MDTWKAVSEERSTLADDLAALDDDQWDAQSLCREWKVRHVVGHVIAGADVKTGPFIAGMLKSGLNFNRCIARRLVLSPRSHSLTSCATALTSVDRLASPGVCRRPHC
jgi:hypothetical protein